MISTLLVAQLALAQVGVIEGEVVVVPDPSGQGHTTNNLIAGLGSTLCAYASKGVYSVKPDVFDAIVVFTTHPLSGMAIGSPATPKGTVVRAEYTSGVVWGSPLIVLQPSDFGSPQRLLHCAFMGPLQNLPANPDDDFLLPAFPTGTMPSGTTGIEVLGHEFGHHWMVLSAFDTGNGLLDALHRSDDRMPLMGMQMNRVSAAGVHYSHLADTQSVMYGNFITPLGGGMYRLSGGARKYGPMDQYFMGLLPPAMTPPMLVLDDGSGMGLIGTPLRAGETETVSAQREVRVSVDDFVRAQGVRMPAFPNTKRCFRVAFALAVQQGQTATPQQIAMVDAYRRRWEQWFKFATDRRGSSVTSLDVFAPCPEPEIDADGGVVPEVDAGVLDGGEDAGSVVEMDSGVVQPSSDGGDDGRIDTGKIRPGCGCGASDAVLALALLALLRRRKLHSN
ncbi:MAG: hypothetical protein JNM17_31715 [Archangium sp.]|nr:hypothetical protein [Archangium sp.]